MWGYLVIMAGGFFYTTGAILNAKATPSTTQLQSQTTAQSMFVWHMESQKKPNRWPITSSEAASIGLADYKDTRWQSRRLHGNCKITYRLRDQPLPYPQAIASDLIRYVNANRSVGYIDATGIITAVSNKGPSLNSAPSDARDSPFIYEC